MFHKLFMIRDDFFFRSCFLDNVLFYTLLKDYDYVIVTTFVRKKKLKYHTIFCISNAINREKKGVISPDCALK